MHLAKTLYDFLRLHPELPPCDIASLDPQKFQQFLDEDRVAKQMLKFAEKQGYEVYESKAEALITAYRDTPPPPDNPLAYVFHAVGVMPDEVTASLSPEQTQRARQNHRRYRAAREDAIIDRIAYQGLQGIARVQPWITLIAYASIANSPTHLHPPHPEAYYQLVRDFIDGLDLARDQHIPLLQSVRTEAQILAMNLYAQLVG